MKHPTKTLSIELIARAGQHGSRTAILDADGAITYHDLLLGARRAAAHLLDGRSDLGEARVACLVAPGRRHVIAQWGIWLAGGVAVPLCLTHPRPEREYMIADSGASVLVADREFEALARSLAAGKDLRLVLTHELGTGAPAPEFAVLPERRALIIYTSGTTGKPKGVVLTHRNLQAQVACLVGAWGWSADDHVLHVLPLHHVHGIVNVLACALWSGAVCEMLPRFDAAPVWRSFLRRDLTLFMAVPVIYHRLIAAWEKSDAAMRRSMTEACRSMRLMVCGSAALPVPVLEKWREVSGHTLLERYGMTEIGMALSNPLRGERVPGMVGSPLRGVDVRLVDETGRLLGDGQPGEIEVRGPGVFGEYWGRPEETVAAYREGWFRTGDVAIRAQGIYRILGRQSVDIIKTGAYKVSALEIEQELLSHPRIEECAVVGVPDEEWGERVCAAIKWAKAEAVSLDELRAWCKERLAVYKIPSRILSVEALPRNAMGKVTKKDVQAMFTAPTKSSRSCPIGGNI